jgi:tRNA (cmo5U34)-methyltransferase
MRPASPPEKHADDLYRTGAGPGRFEFNQAVARVFDDMLERSVPLYRECLSATVGWAARYARPGSRVYDLGCSTGSLAAALANALPGGVHLVGVDNSPAMLEKAREKLQGRCTGWELIEADLAGNFRPTDASVVVLNYTLQFLPPHRRGELLKKIHQGMRDGGLLLLIEKITAENLEYDETLTALYHDYKRERGYTELEIARKRDALENVLIPMPPAENRTLIAGAGFRAVELFFRWNNFAGFVALK